MNLTLKVWRQKNAGTPGRFQAYEATELLHDETTIVRAFVGYAGWSKGQLEGELAQRTWLVRSAGLDILDLDRCPIGIRK